MLQSRNMDGGLFAAARKTSFPKGAFAPIQHLFGDTDGATDRRVPEAGRNILS
jgi:hypothetical protein